MWAILITSLMHMGTMAISPALNQMKTVAFPQIALSKIQTAFATSGLVMPCISLLSAAAIRYGLVTKRTVVAIGFLIQGLIGILSLFLHSELWHVALLSGMSGFAAGCYLTTSISIMMDQFDTVQRRRVMGYQSVFVNTGAILLGICGGLLAAWRWYGGYLILLAGMPMAVIAFLALPREKRSRSAGAVAAGSKSKLKPVIFYYTAIIAVFMMTSAVCGYNLAVHMAAAGVGSTAVVGTLTSFQMVGGAIIGFVFGRLSAKLKDYMLTVGFTCLFIGLTILSVFHTSLPCAFAGVFFSGVSLSIVGPQCIISSAGHVDKRSSALASSLINGLAPGFGNFLSPIIFTNLTDAIVKDSTVFRYQFVAFFALACAAVLAVVTYARARRARLSLTEAVCEELS